VKKLHLVALVVCLAIPVLVVLGLGRSQGREGVGPWDTYDHPSPESGSTLPKPANLKIAKDYSYTFPSGHQVTLRAISRGIEGPKELKYNIGERAWLPDGSPYLGGELRQTNDFYRPVAKEQQGVRGLAFDIQSPNDYPVEIYGYMPETAKMNSQRPEIHGRDQMTQIHPSSRWGSFYRVPLVVEDDKASRYRFGLATGAWSHVFTTTSLPSNIADREIAKGSWGKLRMIAPKKYWAYSGPGPSVSFVLEPADPVTMSYRVRLFDKSGAEVGASRSSLRPTLTANGVMESGYKNLGKVVIEGRPFEFVEFQNVRFNPDPKKWGKSHWGDEGSSKVHEIPDVASLLGVLDPKVITHGSWEFADFYANDGVPWRESPEPDYLNATFSGGEWTDDSLVAVFKLDSKIVEAGQTVTIDGYASTSSTPGEGLGAKLEPKFIRTFQRQRAQVKFVRQDTEYVQFKIQVSGEDWKKEGEVKPPSTGAFEVMIQDGALNYLVGPQLDAQRGLVTWPADGREVRLMARLKSGDRMKLDNNGAHVGGSDPKFTGPLFIFRQNNGGQLWLDSVRSQVLLKDIEAFEVESRSYSKPQYLVAKLPPRKSDRPK
jgi:hypothetical protein